ncbi:hypothetical protein M8C21_018988 [Ambrosia artemisiifolia]|uniref:RST domain-containing protein n=1 Tax=Ambrosia artemisiifolia TaxID=4212 RepID=A0AAD5GVH9_AMBAR|nr:hypothetical protein M8C21_018988 [Ambrosia artemisiifolia]
MTPGQAANATKRWAGTQVPFGLLLPDIQSQLDKDRAMQLQGLYNRLKSNNINKKDFVRHMRTLVGDHTVKMAVYKLEQRGQLFVKQNTQKSSASVATSSIRRSSDSNTRPTENKSQKTQLMEHQSDSRGVQHMGFPQSSFSTYRYPSGNYHTGASPNTNMSSVSLQTRQGPVHPVRMHGGGSTHFISSLPNLSHWQPSMHESQSLMSSMAYGGPDHMDQMNGQQQKSQVSASQGPSSFLQVSGVPGSSKDNTFEMLSSIHGFSKPVDKPGLRSITAQLKLQNASAGNLSSAAGSNAKTPPQKQIVAQKKPLEAPHVSSLSKRQKVCGTFSDQSIEQFTDVTAVSGVDLREEEEQLFSGFNEENRVSEDARKLVREEEERLFLQKVPLQKKVAEIMSKCGVKNKSNDVERCISWCVKERMHGLITNLIRVSKQRVDIEKPRHRTVITSDIRQQIMSLNQKAREECEEKQVDADKLKRAAEASVKLIAYLKVNKVEDDKSRTADANVAARAALGGHDMLSKWQLKAEQARQKRKGGPGAASASKPSLDVGFGSKPEPTSEKNSTKDNPERTSGPVTTTSGPISIPLRRTISVKDVISVLGRETQMSRSILIHRLYANV